MWTYATCGMSFCTAAPDPIELHLFGPVAGRVVNRASYRSRPTITALTSAWARRFVNFGRPWIDGSSCSYGLVSLPYLDGPSLEEFHSSGNARLIRFLWLIPITAAERDFKKRNGLEALQQRFEEAGFNYLDPARASVV